MRLVPDEHGPIGPGEALLAAIGMRPVVTHEIENIPPETWKRARDLQFEVNKAAHALVHGGLPDPEEASDRPGYYRMLRDLATPYQPEQVRAMLEHVPEEFLQAGVEFVVLAATAFKLLQGALPRQMIASLTGGAKALPPPVRLMDRFDSLYNVLDNPLQLLNRAATGQLLRSQVAAVGQVFPTLAGTGIGPDGLPRTGYIQLAVARELVLAQAEDAEFELPRRTEIGCETLLGVDPNSPALRQILQSGGARVQAEAAPSQPVNDVPTPQQFMTRTQRTDANAP